MAFDLEPGEYTFEMTYVPKGAGAGILVSALSLVCFAAAVAVQRFYRAGGEASPKGFLLRKKGNRREQQ